MFFTNILAQFLLLIPCAMFGQFEYSRPILLTNLFWVPTLGQIVLAKRNVPNLNKPLFIYVKWFVYQRWLMTNHILYSSSFIHLLFIAYLHSQALQVTSYFCCLFSSFLPLIKLSQHSSYWVLSKCHLL